MRYTGNLDVQRALERTFRRARLPLLYSQGFNPRPRINLASALPLGVTSQEEITDVWFNEQVNEEKIQEELNKACPPGLKIVNTKRIDNHAATLQTQLLSADYSITFLNKFPGLTKALRELLTQNQIIRVRRGKKYDLRPLIEDLKELPLDKNDRQRILVRLSASQIATGRPEEVVDALGYDYQATRIHRERLLFNTEDLKQDQLLV